MLKYGIFGANGRMGKKLKEVASKFLNKAVPLKFFTSENKVSLKDIKELDFVIDFSNPEASISLAKIAQNTNILIVCGTTGFSEVQFKEFENLSKGVKILYSANFSLGVNRVFKIIKELSELLNGYEVEILEKHHSGKKDAPSGTALEMGRIVANAKGLDFEKVKSVDRNHLRKGDEIGFACIRQGKVNGFHEISFVSENEKIWVGHEAFNKDIFAIGATEVAIKACNKLISSKYGFFSISDIV